MSQAPAALVSNVEDTVERASALVTLRYIYPRPGNTPDQAPSPAAPRPLPSH